MPVVQFVIGKNFLSKIVLSWKCYDAGTFFMQRLNSQHQLFQIYKTDLESCVSQPHMSSLRDACQYTYRLCHDSNIALMQ